MDTLVPALVLAAFMAPLAVAAVWDAWKFKIPNLLTGPLAVAFVPAALLAPGPVDWLWHLGAGAAVLTVGAVLFALRKMGGGDVKLAAACALWMGPLTPVFLLIMAVLGGVVALGLLFARRFAPVVLSALPNPGAVTLPRALLPGEAVPYGVAIAAAGLILAHRLPLLTV
ncbi:MAG: prepilin peptidase [Rhodospirillaceae bacterium]